MNVRSTLENTVSVVGLGYVGLPLALSAAEAGWNVQGIDINQLMIDDLKVGKTHIRTVSDLELQRALDSEKINFFTNFNVIENSKIIILCIPTPLDIHGNPELSHLNSAILAITPYLKNNSLIITESTSYPGTLRNLIVKPILKSHLSSGKKFYFAVAPERVNPGDGEWTNKNTPRIVAGLDSDSTSMVKDFYETICDTVIASEFPEEVEAAKLLENAFRFVNISFINEFARICNSKGLSSKNILEMASTKPYGFMKFNPGIGAGGHCIPVDPVYFSTWARESNEISEILELSISINKEVPRRVFSKAMDLLASSPSKPTVLIVGMSYKPGVSDLRESPSVLIAELLINNGVKVIWHDPLVDEWNQSRSSPIDSGCDLIIFALKQLDLDIEYLAKTRISILNCTNFNFGGDNVISFL